MSLFISIKRMTAGVARASRIAVVGTVAMTALALATQGASAESFWQQVQQRGALRCAAALSPPYVMKDPKTGEYGGAYLDLCKQFAKVLGVKVEFVDTNWDNIIAGLQAGKWDMSPALNRTPTRAMAISYSTTTAYDEMNFAYLAANSKIKSPNPDLSTFDQPNVRIGVLSGSAQDKAASQRLTKAQIVRLPSTAGLGLALLSGRVDVSAQDSATNQLLQLAHPGKINILEAEPALMKQGISFGLPASVSWHDMQVLNIFLEEKVALGEVQAMLKHYSEVMLSQDKGQ